MVLLGVLTPFERRLARVSAAPPWWRWQEIREAAHVSRIELAAELEVDVATVNRWEHGKRTPRGELLDRYLECLAAMEKAAGKAS
jgi:DNA-binding transcriptional regulator YiaG